MKLTRSQIIDFAVLALRWYLAVFMIDYGWGKMTGGQFDVHDPKILEQPVKLVDKFYLSWYLFSLSRTFSIVVGLSQVLGAVLLVFNRTVIAGALVLLPILLQIFLIDVSFTMSSFGSALPVRLAFMMLYDLLILYYYKERVITAWHAITKGTTTMFRYKWWVFLLLPLLALFIDLISMPVSKLINVVF